MIRTPFACRSAPRGACSVSRRRFLLRSSGNPRCPGGRASLAKTGLGRRPRPHADPRRLGQPHGRSLRPP